MDAYPEKMMRFAIVPIETLLACRYILFQVHCIIVSNISPYEAPYSRDMDAIDAHYNRATELVASSDTVWPLIIEQRSRIHDNITELIENATEWLERSAFSTSFAEQSKALKKYLTPPRGFSASGLAIRRDGTVSDRDCIILEQRIVAQAYKNDLNRLKSSLIDSYEGMVYFEDFLMTLAWMKEEPLRRMFSREFRGAYLEHVQEVQDGTASDHVSLAGK